MKIGIFARTFNRPSLDEVLGVIQAYGFETVQLNLLSAGMPALPESLDEQLLIGIRSSFARYGLEMAAVSGTFNAIHPDLTRRNTEILRCVNLIKACPQLGTTVVTLCTGTRDPDNMWRTHPGNNTPETWRELIETLTILLENAEATGVDLGIEPEMANVINSARKARNLLDELKSPRLKIILDGANLLSRETAGNQKTIFSEAIDLLGPDIFMVHAKDFPLKESQTQAAGKGEVDFPFYLGLVKSSGFNGPVVLHNLSEAEVPQSTAYVRELLSR